GGFINMEMDFELYDSAIAQLQMIESVYDLNILNIEEVAKWIASKTDDEKEILSICSALNSWIMMQGTYMSQGGVKIPKNLIDIISNRVLRLKREGLTKRPKNY
ncbi:MAG: hypothetical protein ACE5KT_11675, partial [Methanosarcinales archaeon]